MSLRDEGSIMADDRSLFVRKNEVNGTQTTLETIPVAPNAEVQSEMKVGDESNAVEVPQE